MPSAASRPTTSGRKRRESPVDFASVTARLHFLRQCKKPCSDEKRKLRHRLLAAADEVNNLVGIAGLNKGALPICARQNVAVALNCNAFRRDSQVREKRGDIQAVGNFAWLAINHNVNRHLHGAVQDFVSGGAGLALERNA